MSENNVTLAEMLHVVVEELTANDPDTVMTRIQIFDKVDERFEEQNRDSLQGHLLAATVNMPSRVRWWPNKRPRTVAVATKHDLLFSEGIGSGRFVKYDPAKHGIWEIQYDEVREKMMVVTVDMEIDEVMDDSTTETQPSGVFAMEAHLRDYLVKNPNSLTIEGKRLTLEDKEYLTDVGKIDILAKDDDGNFYVFELKRNKGVDDALGQILRYMGWIIAKKANGKSVNGIIVAEKIAENLKYAIQAVNNIYLYEYEVNFHLKKTSEL